MTRVCRYVAVIALAMTPMLSIAEISNSADKFKFTGDFRVRYETNSAAGTSPSWDRGVLRGRLAGIYTLTDSIELGARLVTGDPDNPRTADITMGDFGGNLDLSLDRAYVSYQTGSLFLTAGKFAKPFSSTELVWDGDVNPQGLAARFNFIQDNTWSAQASAIFFPISESIFEEDSDMLGTQLSVSVRPGKDWSVGLHGAYFEYEIGRLDPNAPGYARGNNLGPEGTTLLSDFELLDFVGSVTYLGFGERWSLKLVGDYVRNLGAAVPEDSGYGFDLFLGNLDQPGRLLFRYGYSQAETDAILGMFSHDNIAISTNYVLHTLAVDYALWKHTYVGLTTYRYRYLDPEPGAEFGNDWGSRTRLNLYFSF